MRLNRFHLYFIIKIINSKPILLIVCNNLLNLKKTKSDVILGTLTKNELKAFDKFISHSLNNKSREVLNYWHSRFSVKSVSLNTSNIKSVSRKTLSDFNKQLEKYLIFNSFKKDKFSGTLYLTRELRERSIEKYFEQIISEINKLRHVKLGKGFQNTLILLKLNFEEYLLHNSRSDEKNMQRLSKERIKLSEYVVAFSKLFEYFNDIYFSEDKKHTDSGLLTMRNVIQYVEKNKTYFIKYYPNLWTLYLIYIAIDDSYNYDRIQTAIKYFRKNEKHFTDGFLQFGYSSLFKVIFTKINSGYEIAYNDFCKILLDNENSGIIKRITFIQPRNLPSFVSAALFSNNIEFAEKLVTVYSSKIIESLREQVIYICRAIIEFSKGNYSIVIRMLKNTKPRDPMLYIFCKTTLIKAYYETNAFRNIYPLIDSVKHYLQRRTDIAELYPNVLKFLNYSSKLTQSKGNNRKGFELIKEKLSKENYFFEKKWTLEKLNQLSSDN